MDIVKRKDNNNAKKVLIVGEDKSGKSTFAEEYCKKNNLKAVVLDFLDTNYTEMDLVTDIPQDNSMKLFRFMKKFIKEFEDSEYSALIIDGIDTLSDGLISDGKGLSKYSDRGVAFNKIIRLLKKTNKSIIFIGQTNFDMDFYHNEETPNRPVILTNAFVNEKFRCKRVNESFNVETVSRRGV